MAASGERVGHSPLRGGGHDDYLPGHGGGYVRAEVYRRLPGATESSIPDAGCYVRRETTAGVRVPVVAEARSEVVRQGRHDRLAARLRDWHDPGRGLDGKGEAGGLRAVEASQPELEPYLRAAIERLLVVGSAGIRRQFSQELEGRLHPAQEAVDILCRVTPERRGDGYRQAEHRRAGCLAVHDQRLVDSRLAVVGYWLELQRLRLAQPEIRARVT